MVTEAHRQETGQWLLEHTDRSGQWLLRHTDRTVVTQQVNRSTHAVRWVKSKKKTFTQPCTVQLKRLAVGLGLR